MQANLRGCGSSRNLLAALALNRVQDDDAEHNIQKRRYPSWLRTKNTNAIPGRLLPSYMANCTRSNSHPAPTHLFMISSMVSSVTMVVSTTLYFSTCISFIEA